MLTIPSRRFAINSRLSAMEIAKGLRDHTQPRYKWFRSQPENTRFVGTIGGDRFRLVPVFKGRNSYAPWILGHIAPNDSGSSVELTMTLHPVVVLLMLGIVLVPQYWAVAKEGGFNLWWLAVMGGFHVVMYYIGFVPEVHKTEAWFRDFVTG